MNRDETAGAIEVMQAYVDGRGIEVRQISPPSSWHPKNEMVSWDWHGYAYRIKPEPREWWVHVHHEKIALVSGPHNEPCQACIRVREVIE